MKSLGFNLVLVLLASATVEADTGSNKKERSPHRAVITRGQIEADWLRQDEVRSLPAGDVGKVTPREDAAGGCDGVRDGSFGFHTSREQDPWWQVDLGREVSIGEVLIYNRGDACSHRARRLRVLLSGDGTSWTAVYNHDGSEFGGMWDGKPLSVLLHGAKGRFVRIQLPGNECLHLDEVEVFDTSYHRNYALGKPANQSSSSPWSTGTLVAALQTVRERGGPFRPSYGGPFQADWLALQVALRHSGSRYPTAEVVQRGFVLAANLRQLGTDVAEEVRILQGETDAPKQLTPDADRKRYFRARWAVRRMAFANRQLDFDRLVFVKRAPSRFSHMSIQYYGAFSRPGGGLYILENFKSDSPRLRCLTAELPPGDILRPDLSYDAGKVLFAYCKFCPGLAEKKNKLDKSKIPEDAFYHLYEMNLDGSGLRRLTRGKYDDFDGRYLPNGEIVFLSTRKGQFLQCGKASAQASCAGALPDSYARCGGGPALPVAVYTLHVIDGDGHNLRAISAFESFEWTPSVADDGRILYARWDYVDREAMSYESLWSTLPDGTGAQAVFGNYTVSPFCIFEPRCIPGSRKLVFTASAHHSPTAGSLVLLDPNKGADGPAPLTRLTPEVPFPEVEAWPATYYANPFPLSEQYYLVAWSDQPLVGEPKTNPSNTMGIYLYDAFGNLNLIYRDPEISSMYPIPVRPRRRPPAVASSLSSEENSGPPLGEPEGRVLLLDVYKGLESNWSGKVHRLRIVGVTPKTQPKMHSPPLGMTKNDTGKFVLGTVPVETDGSAFFRVPSGLPFFVQALDAEGMAVQTMRSVTYVRPGQTQTCIGCHESRNTSPSNRLPRAALREPSKMTPGPVGSWPLDFSSLMQPLLEKHCVRCHQEDAEAAKTDLTAAKAYETLVGYGDRNLRAHVWTRHRQGFSTPGACGAASSPLMKLLQKGHYQVKLSGADMDRLITWMDTYAQRAGSFSADQDRRLGELRLRMARLLAPSN